jgi:exodeoxyribonuclease VII large subunit
MSETPGLFDAPAARRDLYTVTRLNREAKDILEGSFPRLWVQGEISNLARPASGHLYFSLKDQRSQVRCAMFRGRGRATAKFTPENGMLVNVRASVSLYEARGEFQLIVEELEAAGAGDLQRAFEELKQKLLKEGLFDESLKKPLPSCPRRIGVVTSPSGAAIRDILHVLERRWPVAAVLIYPTPVQGAAAIEGIVAALDDAGRRAECDVLIVARGGGSIEDLWAFNAEAVARAIHACPLPVVTGIGHEIDFTIADFVADRRAPTPSAAAELVSPDRNELLARLAVLETRQAGLLRQTLRDLRRTLDHLSKRLPHPLRRLRELAQRLDELGSHLGKSVRQQAAERRARLLELAARLNLHNPAQALRHHRERCAWLGAQLGAATGQRLRDLRAQLEGAAHTLQAVGPQNTLARGYAIVTDGSGRIVRDAAALAVGAPIAARFAAGAAQATVTRIDKK